MSSEVCSRGVKNLRINIVCVAIFLIIAIVVFMQFKYKPMNPILLLDMFCVSSLTAFSYTVIAPYTWDKMGNKCHIVFRIFTSLFVCAITSIIVTAISTLFSVYLGYTHFVRGFAKYAPFYIYVHAVPMLLLGYIISSWKQTEEKLESAVASMLSTQVDNHALYNCISYGVALALKENAKETMELFSNMADYFRKVTELSRDGLIYLGDERKLIADYINFRCYGFKDDLKIEWKWDKSLNELPLPPMIFQPLVENAVKHGVGLTMGGTLRVILERTTGGIRIAIENAVAPESLKSKLFYKKTGVGIENLKSRLGLSFGRSAKFKLSIKEGWATAEILISKKILNLDTNQCNCRIYPIKILEN